MGKLNEFEKLLFVVLLIALHIFEDQRVPDEFHSLVLFVQVTTMFD